MSKSVKVETVTLSKERSIISRLKKERLQDQYVINNLKCLNRHLRDKLIKHQKLAEDALEMDDCMFESMNNAVESGSHLTHNGDTIYYPGEIKKRKSSI